VPRALLLALLITFLSSCVIDLRPQRALLYAGARRPTAEVAVLDSASLAGSLPSEGETERAWAVLSVDGCPVLGFFLVQEWELEPGRHVLVLLELSADDEGDEIGSVDFHVLSAALPPGRVCVEPRETSWRSSFCLRGEEGEILATSTRLLPPTGELWFAHGYLGLLAGRWQDLRTVPVEVGT